MHNRLKTFHGHLSKVGKNLGRAVEGYNSAVASFEGRVLPKARTIEALSQKEGLPDFERIEKVVRDVDVQELPEALPEPEETL